MLGKKASSEETTRIPMPHMQGGLIGIRKPHSVKTLVTMGISGNFNAYTDKPSGSRWLHREAKNVYFMRFLTGKSGFDKTVVGKQYLSNAVGIDNNY